jgi:RND family efflux transporter MFP subunit
MKCVRLAIGLYILLVTPLAYADTDTQPTSEQPQTELVNTVPIAERHVAETLPVYGTLEPLPRQNLTLATSRDSIIDSVAVNRGERVSKGQVMITLAPTPQSRDAWLQAKSGLAYAQASLMHTRSLYKEQLATRDQLAAAEKALSDAQATLAMARQAGGGGLLPLRASRDAVVTSVLVNTGERVPANATLMTLAADGGLQARLGVAPEQAAAVHAGLRVNLNLVFDRNLTIIGKLTSVSGMLDANTGLLDVFMSLPHGAHGFLPGAQVQGEIIVSDERSLAVPRTAVLRDDQGAYVFVVTQHIAHRVDVQIGADDGAWVAVIGDLKPGEAVVTLGNYELSDGMQVREPAR